MSFSFGMPSFISTYIYGEEKNLESSSKEMVVYESEEESSEHVLDDNPVKSLVPASTVHAKSTSSDSESDSEDKQKIVKGPVILSCGHFFELQLIDDHRRSCMAKKQDFTCLKGCGKVEDKIIESKQLRKTIKETDEQIKLLNDALKIIDNKTEKIKVLKARCVLWNTQVENLQLDAKKSEKIVSDLKKIYPKITKMSAELLRIKSQSDIKDRQIKNALNPRIRDVFNCYFWPQYVMDRDITDKEKDTLKEPVLSKKEIEKLIADLEGLKLEEKEIVKVLMSSSESESSYSVSSSDSDSSELY